MTSPSDIRQLALRHAPLALFGAVLIWHSLQYSFVTDDAYISFVYSRNLAEHAELVFNPGANPVEGYTNFLWTFLLGVLMLFGLPPEATSLVLGTGFGLGVLVIAFRLLEHLGGEQSPWDHLAPALLAMSSGFACWSSGGLETQMFTFWVALSLHAYARAASEPRWMRRAGVFLALAAMTRPEGLLVAAVLGVHRLAHNLLRDRRLRPLGDELAGAGWFLALWAPWFLWRFWYYGHPLPNTYYVKAAGPAAPEYHQAMLDSGLYYVWQWAVQSKALYAAPLVLFGLVAARPRSRRFVFGTAALALTALYLIYTVRVGGDFMGLHRFVMPLFFVVAVATALGLRLCVSAIRPERWRRAAAVAAVGLVGIGFGWTQLELTRESVRHGNWHSDRGIDTPAYLAVYAHDRRVIGRHMRPCFRATDFSIFGGVGAKPYHARARGIDVFGLVSERIAHEVPRTRARPGHNKWGPNELLLDYDPDFVFSCYSLHHDPARPQFNCSAAYWLARGYEQVTLRIPGLRERGEHYTFFVKESREFECQGRVR